MTSVQATVLIAACGLILTFLSALGGLLVNITRKWTRIEDKLESLVHEKEETHRAMLEQMTVDREATHERLLELERFVWPRPKRM